MPTRLRVLIAEDRPTDAELIVYELRQAGFDPDWTRVDTEKDYLAHLSQDLDLILTDHSMPDFDSRRALELLQEQKLDIPLIVVTGSIGEEKAVELIRKGADDYFLKDRLARLGEAARRVLEEKRLRIEKKLAAQALRESEASFRLLFFANPHPMWVFAVDTLEILEVNESAVKQYGYSHDEFLKMLIADLHPDDSSNDLARKLFTQDTGMIAPSEWRHRRKNGEIIDVELLSHPLHFSGRRARMVSAHDITMRKRTEESILAARVALERQNQRLSALYEAAQLVNATLNIDEVLDFVVDAAIRATHAKHGAALLVSETEKSFEWHAFRGFDPDEIEQANTLILKVTEGLNGRAYKSHEVVIVDDVTGQQDYYNLIENTRSEMVIPILREGTVLGNIDLQSPDFNAFHNVDLAYLKALTEQAALAITNSRLYRELESYNEYLELAVNERTSELLATKDRVETILSSVGDGLMVLNKDGRIQQVNAAFLRQTGFSIGEAEMRDHHTLLHLEFGSQGDYKNALDLLGPGEVWMGETRVQRKDASVFDASLTIAPVRNDQGAITMLVASIRDITQLKEVERAKDAFVSNVSHELRTPITSLRLTHDLMRRAPDRMDVFMQRLGRDVERLNLLIEDLLRLSRLEQNRVEMDLKPVDMNQIAAQYFDDRAPLAESHHLTLKLEPLPKVPPVEADSGLLGQVLSVLLTNAFNYTPEGGSVTIRTHIRDDEDMQWAGFSVSDTGPGISPSEHGELFKRFYRGTVGRDSGATGTGLGLAIAKEIVDRHSGRIEIVSEGIPGKGARFIVWLPVAAEKSVIEESQ